MKEIPAVALEIVLKQDGIELKGQGAERETRCWNPNHDDDRPSMRVNVQKGAFFCHGCKISGNVINYLRDQRHMDGPEIAAFLREQGWAEEKIHHNASAAENIERERQNRPRLVPDVPDKIGFQKQQCPLVTRYDYFTPDGELVAVVARYAYKKDGAPDKTFRQFTPARNGGLWCSGPTSNRIPPEDRVEKWPLYNIAQALERAGGQTGEWIWVVEGEKCCDLLAGLKDRPKGPLAVVSLSGGSGAGGPKGDFTRHDLSPLYGAQVMIVADADGAGRKYARQLAKHVVGVDASSKVVCVLPEDADGYDVGDAVAAGGHALAEEWLRSQKREMIEADAPPPPTPEEASELILDNPFYEVRGLHQHAVVFRLKRTHENYMVPRAGVGGEGHLIAMAPLSFWRDVMEGRDMTRAKKAMVADILTREAERKGFLSRIETSVGRGAFTLPDGVCFNAGDRVLVEDDEGLLTNEKQFDEISAELSPGFPIAIKTSDDAEDYSSDLAAAIERYRFAHPMDARAFVGWMVTALVGGGLPFRPMLWLAGPPNSGKTFLLEHLLYPFFDTLHASFSDVSEAALIAEVGGDSIPVLVDEAEPDRSSTGDLIGMVRLATSGRGKRSRGTAEGGSRSYQPRFSMMFSSVARPRLSAAESQRIYPVALSSERIEITSGDNWPAVRDAMLAAVQPERAQAIRSHIILNAGRIAQNAIDLAESLVSSPHRAIGTRDAQIAGALTAGYRFLSGKADAWVERRLKTVDDRYDLLNAILGHMIRFSGKLGVQDVPLAELLLLAKYTPNGIWDARHKPGIDQLARSYGLSLLEPGKLAIAPPVPALKAIMERTQWSRMDLREYLLGLGAVVERDASGKPKRLYCAGRQVPCVILGKEILDAVALTAPEPYEQRQLGDDNQGFDHTGDAVKY